MTTTKAAKKNYTLIHAAHDFLRTLGQASSDDIEELRMYAAKYAGSSEYTYDSEPWTGIMNSTEEELKRRMFDSMDE